MPHSLFPLGSSFAGGAAQTQQKRRFLAVAGPLCCRSFHCSFMGKSGFIFFILQQNDITLDSRNETENIITGNR
jgi:hypothetical protein